ncbi:GPC4 [Cordylochernes scorpioides]|uniref:GPC4 n=1 Tax=Cordylochernes scorpioides TaxID=51811 RepID=A0ABY6KYX7_9ARAC|nr:GPC4 [Cordylochernes scorpioides]
MVFRNGGKVARPERWYWGQSPLSVTSKYTYLGYPLTPSISFTQVALNYRGRTMAAMGAVGEIILKSKLKSFHASMRLLDSMILTVLLYAAPIWAHDQALILDRIQDTFLRRFLCLPSYTPGYILRAETGRHSLDITVKKLTLKFWTIILKMDGSRLSSICLAHLWDISISSKQNIGLSWGVCQQKINSQYTFSSSYLECVGSHMSSLKPFGDSPQKMTTEIRRAFIAMRTFVKSLREVRKVVKDMMEVAVFPECSRALMRMTYCPHCYGEPQLPPCPSYCMNVLRGCLAYHADLDPNWNLFVEAMVTLAFQLESAFNLETVIDPLNIKISEAIMNFQENGVAISKKIFEECGQPRLRQKRQVFGEEDEDTTNAAAEVVSGPLQFNYHGSRTPTVRGTSLDRLVVGAKKQLRQTKSFWSHLGDLLCNSNYLRPMPAGNLQPCWDGKTRTLRYNTQLDW